MKAIECKIKSYPIKKPAKDTKKYTHLLFALTAKRPDGGYNIVIELGMYNHRTHAYQIGKVKESLHELDLVINDDKKNEIDNLLRKHAGLPHTKDMPVISFPYTNDVTLYEAIGSFEYPKSGEFKIQAITNLAKDKESFAKYISEHYKIEPKTEPIILEVN